MLPRISGNFSTSSSCSCNFTRIDWNFTSLPLIKKKKKANGNSTGWNYYYYFLSWNPNKALLWRLYWVIIIDDFGKHFYLSKIGLDQGKAIDSLGVVAYCCCCIPWLCDDHWACCIQPAPSWLDSRPLCCTSSAAALTFYACARHLCPYPRGSASCTPVTSVCPFPCPRLVALPSAHFAGWKWIDLSVSIAINAKETLAGPQMGLLIKNVLQ